MPFQFQRQTFIKLSSKPPLISYVNINRFNFSRLILFFINQISCNRNDCTQKLRIKIFQDAS